MNAYENEIQKREDDDFELSEELIMRMAARMSEFDSHVRYIAQKYLNASGCSGDVTHIEWVGFTNSIDVNYEIYNGYREAPSQRDISMPITLLWDKDAMAKIDKINDDRVATEKLEAEQQKRRIAEENTKRELKKLAELKAKYEED